MNSLELLKLTKSELEDYLNSTVSNVSETSEHPETVKRAMIREVEQLFDDSVGVLPTNVRYSGVYISIVKLGLTIFFKISVKKTGKTVQVSRLRKRDVVCANKFKIDDIQISIRCPHFEKSDSGTYMVTLSPYFSDEYCSIINHDGTFENIISPDKIMHSFSAQLSSWADIRKEVILMAAQPIIKKEYFQPIFNENDWNRILFEVEKNNSELIDEVIKNMFNFTL